MAFKKYHFRYPPLLQVLSVIKEKWLYVVETNSHFITQFSATEADNNYRFQLVAPAFTLLLTFTLLPPFPRRALAGRRDLDPGE